MQLNIYQDLVWNCVGLIFHSILYEGMEASYVSLFNFEENVVLKHMVLWFNMVNNYQEKAEKLRSFFPSSFTDATEGVGNLQQGQTRCTPRVLYEIRFSLTRTYILDSTW